MAELALEHRLAKIRESFNILCQPDKLEQLNEFCDLMDQQELPAAARLFIFNQGVLSIENMASKHNQVIEKVESAVNLGFSVKCMKDFVQLSVFESDYDYPMSAGTQQTVPTPSLSMESDPANMNRISGLHQQLPSPQPQPNRVSQDTGYYSIEQQPPFAKPRSFSTQLNTPVKQQQPQPQPKSQPVSPPNKSPKGKSFMSLFLFPEKAAAKKPSRKDSHGHKQYNT